MKINYCANCGAKITEGADFCGECGEKVIPIEENIDQCTSCGYQYSPDEKFCPECGANLNANSLKKEEEITKETKKQPPIKKTSNTYKTPAVSIDKKKGGCRSKLGKGFLWLFGILVVGATILYFIGDTEGDNSSVYDSPYKHTAESGNKKETTKYPEPVLKEVLVEAILTEENLIIETENGEVRMSVSPLCINGKTTAKIRKITVVSPFDNCKMKGYDFSVGNGGELGGLVTVEMPYSKNDIPDGYTPEQCITAVHYNEKEKLYEPVHYEIDKQKEKLIIITSELSPLLEILNLTPGEPPISAGTPNLEASQVFTSNDSWESGGNWGVFYTSNEGGLLEQVYKYNFDAAMHTYRDYGGEAIVKKIADYGTENEYRLHIDGSLALFGKIGYLEYSGKIALLEGTGEGFDNFVKKLGYKGLGLESITKTLGHIGMSLAVIQFGSDLYHGRDLAVFKVIKGLVYWQGDNAAKYVAVSILGAPVAASAAAVATYSLACLFVLEQFLGPIESWNDDQFSKLSEHQKLFSAFNKYYNNSDGKAYRDMTSWYKIVAEINEQSLKSNAIPQGMQRDEYFEKLLREELIKYASEFWTNLTLNERIDLVIASPFGYFYGDYGAIHYAGNKNDKEKMLYTYLEEIANGKYPSMGLTGNDRYLVKKNSNIASTISYNDNKKMAKQYLMNFDSENANWKFEEIKQEMIKFQQNYLMEKRIRPLMEYKTQRMYLESKKQLRKGLDKLTKDLNKFIKIDVIDKSDEIAGTKPYANHIVVPKSDYLSKNKQLSQWQITLNDDGNGSIYFSNIAYIRSGGFTQLEIYPPGTKDFNHKKPVEVVDFSIIDNSVQINLLFEKTSVFFADRNLVGPPGTTFDVEALATPENTYRFVWQIDGWPETHTHEGKKSSIAPVINKKGQYNVTVKLYDLNNKFLSKDTVTIYVEDGIQLSAYYDAFDFKKQKQYRVEAREVYPGNDITFVVKKDDKIMASEDYKYIWKVNGVLDNSAGNDREWGNNFYLRVENEARDWSEYVKGGVIGIGVTSVCVEVSDKKGRFIGKDCWSVQVKKHEEYLDNSIMPDGDE